MKYCLGLNGNKRNVHTTLRAPQLSPKSRKMSGYSCCVTFPSSHFNWHQSLSATMSDLQFRKPSCSQRQLIRR